MASMREYFKDLRSNIEYLSHSIKITNLPLTITSIIEDRKIFMRL